MATCTGFKHFAALRVSIGTNSCEHLPVNLAVGQATSLANGPVSGPITIMFTLWQAHHHYICTLEGPKDTFI
jgi:hypothetical protein